MDNKRFCCEQLETFYKTENGISLNFRVVKYKGIFREKMLLLNSEVSDRGFIITSGYKVSVNDIRTSRMIINYCPFCGQKLTDWYVSDNYVQETIG